jgi:regulator of replication initiation timing
MTENLLQKLEEKIVTLLSELEKLQQQISQLKNENHSLKSEKVHSQQKLQTIVTLLDSFGLKELTENARQVEEVLA